jgi:hypothetical protein
VEGFFRDLYITMSSGAGADDKIWETELRLTECDASNVI